jgi:hypothetical protein
MRGWGGRGRGVLGRARAGVEPTETWDCAGKGGQLKDGFCHHGFTDTQNLGAEGFVRNRGQRTE